MRLLVTGGTGFIGSHLAEEGRGVARRSWCWASPIGPRSKPTSSCCAGKASRSFRAASPTRSCANARCEASPTSSTSRWRCGKAPSRTSSSSRSTWTEPGICSRPRGNEGSSASSIAARSVSMGTERRGSRNEEFSPRAGQRVRADEGGGRADGPAVLRRRAAALRHSSAGGRVRAQGSAPPQALQGGGPRSLSAVRQRDGTPAHGLCR